MADYVKPSIPRPVWDQVRQAAARQGLTITAWLRQASTLTDAPPAAASPQAAPQAPRKRHQGVPPVPTLRVHSPAEPTPPAVPQAPAPAPSAEPPAAPAPTRPESLSGHTDYSTGALAARLRSREG